MFALRYHRYGPPDVLQWEKTADPIITTDQLLIANRAVGVNPGDWQIRSGWAARVFGYQQSFPAIPGYDFAGVVQAVGSAVQGYQVGDAVFGMSSQASTSAELLAVTPETIAHIPEGLTFEEAAALPMSGYVALDALLTKAQVQAGELVIINGASGGIGHLAVQLAHSLGASVIAITSARNAEFARALGADEVIDYTSTSLADLKRQADVVLDTVGGNAGKDLPALLKAGGKLIPVTLGDYPEQTPDHPYTLFPMLNALPSNEQLQQLADFWRTGTLRPHLQEIIPLHDGARAHQLSEARHIRGKLVLQVNKEY